jgi:transposase-like protein
MKPSSIDLIEEAASRNRSHSSHSPIQKRQKGSKTGLNYTSLYSTPSGMDSIRHIQGTGHRRFASQVS